VTVTRDREVGTSTPVVEVASLSVERGRDLVLEGVDLGINAGDYIGIVGPNGGGKTTLLLALLGMLPIRSGSIRLFGRDIGEFSEWSRLAFVSQTATDFDPAFPLTVRELVGLGRVNGKNMGRRLGKEDWDKVDETLEFMGISDLSGRRIGHLSGGQKQRMFVAKALVRDPDIIFLDEPVTGVDATAQERFYQKLSDLNTDRGTTILIVSHDLSTVFCRMSHVMCVHRVVDFAAITPGFEPDAMLKRAYGEHFHFVFHEHECEGVFEHE
jgi:zinc transport system ATP-binding protein